MLERFCNDPKFSMNLCEIMRDGLLIIDADGKIEFLNRAAEEITGYNREEIIGKPCTVLDTDSCLQFTDQGKKKCCDLFEKGVLSNKKCRMRTKDGRTVYLLKNAVLLRDGKGEITGAVESMTDITSLYMKELELEELKQELRDEFWFMGILGKSAEMQKLYEQIRNAATSEAPVLICGESGTGKDLVAKAVHKLSRRKKGPYIKMNCAALNQYILESELFGHKKGSFTGAISDRKGRFEAAHKGSIFLDEIGDMPVEMQAKLLRVLEEKVVERVGEHRPIPVDIRLISATNKDMSALIPQEKFREDLLYRINSIFIKVAPLRERKEDIPLLVAHYLKRISLVNNKDIRRISPEAMKIIENYSWPGNVRHLINALEHAAITCKGDSIEVSDLPDYVFHEDDKESKDKNAEKERIISILAKHKGNRMVTAKELGISRVTLWKRLKEYGIN